MVELTNKQNISKNEEKNLSTIDAIYMLKAKKLLMEKGWDKKKGFFNKYISFLGTFESNDEKDLVLELTKNFIWISYEEYLENIMALLSELLIKESEYMKGKKDIIICPLLDLSKNEEIVDIKTKSSKFLCYLFRSCEIISYPLLSDKKISIIEDFYSWKKLENSDQEGVYIKEIISLKKIKKESTLVILVDDFIGSGQTATESLDFFENILELQLDRFRLLTFAIHDIGEKKLRLRIPIYSKYRIKKGISDIEDQSEKNRKLNIMNEIEERLKFKDYEKLGYEKTECLIRLIRTPNNTFPIFHKNNNNIKGIFPRS